MGMMIWMGEGRGTEVRQGRGRKEGRIKKEKKKNKNKREAARAGPMEREQRSCVEGGCVCAASFMCFGSDKERAVVSGHNEK